MTAINPIVLDELDVPKTRAGESQSAPGDLPNTRRLASGQTSRSRRRFLPGHNVRLAPTESPRSNHAQGHCVGYRQSSERSSRLRTPRRQGRRPTGAPTTTPTTRTAPPGEPTRTTICARRTGNHRPRRLDQTSATRQPTNIARTTGRTDGTRRTTEPQRCLPPTSRPTRSRRPPPTRVAR